MLVGKILGYRFPFHLARPHVVWPMSGLLICPTPAIGFATGKVVLAHDTSFADIADRGELLR